VPIVAAYFRSLFGETCFDVSSTSLDSEIGIDCGAVMASAIKIINTDGGVFCPLNRVVRVEVITNVTQFTSVFYWQFLVQFSSLIYF